MIDYEGITTPPHADNHNRNADSFALPWLDKLLAGKHWKLKVVPLLIGLVVLFGLGLNLNKFLVFQGFYLIVQGRPNPDICCHYWADVAYQTTDWLMQKIQVWDVVHQANMRFRLFLPLLYKALDGRPLLVYGVQLILGIPFIYMLVNLAHQIVRDRTLAFIFAAGFVGLYAGAAFLMDVSAYGDGFAFLFMLAALYFRNPALLFLSVFLSAWVDERALLNASFTMLYHLMAPYRTDRPHDFRSVRAFWPTPQVWAVFLGGCAYVAIRLFLTYQYNLTTPLGGPSLFFNVYSALKTFGIRFWSGFEGFWMLILGMFLILWQRRQYGLLGILTPLTFVTTFTILMQGDFTRTLSFGFPLLFVALLIVREGTSKRDLFWILASIAVICTLFFPLYY